MSLFKDAGHLFRFAFLFVIAFVAFLVIRHFVVPKSFGQYGHYRGAAIAEIAAKPIKFAGHDTCETCHADILDAKKSGKHANVNCEACHGRSLAAHANDPSRRSPPNWTPQCALYPLSRSQRCQAQDLPAEVDADQHSGGVPCENLPQAARPGISPQLEAK